MPIPFGRYTLIRKIAAGGMGQVLLAKKGAEGFEKLVVIKRILPHLVEDEEFFSMFIDEAKITMRLDHPNIARINEFGSENGIHFIEMEYVAGEDLRRVVRRAGAANIEVPLGVTLRIFADAAAGLDFAHKARDAKGQPLGLVHRDVSPQNVLLGFDGSVKLIDFGVAKATGRLQQTGTGILKGKFPYMSPEQASGLELDPRSDIFALGVVLWETLTGRRLFKGDNDMMTQRMVKDCQVPAPSALVPGLSAELDGVVLKALAKEPGDRYADAGEFRSALEAFAVKHAIAASNTQLVAFMQSLYADRIAREANITSLEEDSGLTDLDVGGLVRPGGHVTVVDRGRQGQTQGGRTEALAPGQPAGTSPRLLAGLALVLVALGVVAVLLLKRTPGEPVPVTPVTPVVVVPPPVLPEVKPVVPPPPEVPRELALSVTSDPAGAEVELAGERVGVTPLELKVPVAKLPAPLKLTREGYEPAQTSLTEGTASPVSLTLKKRAPRVTPVKPPEIKTSR
jgi:serine/threonine-protein kinase